MHYVLKCACEYLSIACSFFISPSLKNSVACITNKCLDNTISGSNPAKRLQRKNLRKFGKYRRRGKNIKRHYNSNEQKESKNDHKMRVADSDFLANLAYNHRVSKTAETSNVVSDDVPNRQTSKTLEGELWWTKMQEYAAQMPPLEHDATHLTTSDCSMCLDSDFRTPETILKSSSPLKKRTPKINSPKRSLVRDKKAVHYSQPCEGTKSDSKIDSARRDKFDLDVTKSASTKTMKRRISMNKRKNSSARKTQLRKLRRNLL